MAKSILCIVVMTCFMGMSKQQQSKEIQLEAFRIAQSVEKQVTSARALSARVESLLDKARAEYDVTIVSKTRTVESVLNATLQPYYDVISGALQTANLANNSAAKECVAKARASISQQISNGANKDILACQTRTRINLYKFVLKLVSLYNAQGTTSNALSSCPYSFSIESASDLEEARVCYTTANNTIKAYISQTTKDLEESVVTFNALQGNSCLSLGVEVAVKQAQAVVASMVACGKAAGEWLTDANVAVAIKRAYTGLVQYINEVRKSLGALNTDVKSSIDKFNAVNESVEAEYKTALKDILNHIVFVEEFLKDTKNPSALACIQDARAKYEINYNEEIFVARECLYTERASFTYANLSVSINNLLTLLDKGAANATSVCTSKLPLTAESVEKCFNDTLYQLQNKERVVVKEAQEMVSAADNLHTYGLYCLEYHSIDSGERNLNDLAECLKAEKIEFTFDQNGLVSF